VKTLDDRFGALRDELELAVHPTAPGISEFRPASRRVFLSVALAVLLGVGFTAYTRRSARVTPAVSTSNWVEEKSRTMEPTIGQFDKVQVDYNFTTFGRSDLVVSSVPSELATKPMILRVIGLPGESVLVGEDGSVFIDGTPLKENYLKSLADPTSRTTDAFPTILGPDQYYLAGDNRETPAVAVFVVVKRADLLARAERGCSVFMNPDASASQLAAARTVFETDPAVKSFRYIEKNEALEEIKHLFPSSPEMTDLFAPDGQGLPTSFRAVMNRDTDSGGFEARMKLEPGVSILRCGLPIVDAHYEPLVEGPPRTDLKGALVTAAPATTTAPSSETTITG
jgi:signal peptidase I